MSATLTLSQQRSLYEKPNTLEQCAYCDNKNSFYFCHWTSKTNPNLSSPCGKYSCREHTVFWHSGLDYCKKHVVVEVIKNNTPRGVITVENLYHYKDLAEGEYIGRAFQRDFASHCGSPLGNPFLITKETTQTEKTQILTKYRAWLWQQLQLKSTAHNEICRLRDLAIRGIDVRLLCWCKNLQGQGDCHGDIVKKAIEWMIAEMGL